MEKYGDVVRESVETRYGKVVRNDPLHRQGFCLCASCNVLRSQVMRARLGRSSSDEATSGHAHRDPLEEASHSLVTPVNVPNREYSAVADCVVDDGAAQATARQVMLSPGRRRAQT